MSGTRQLYWDDSYRVRFEARVLECLSWEGQPAAVLDETCFYPTSGGQPCDTGKLGEARVLSVVEEGERILHILDRPLAAGRISGEIDWGRRFDHMQQHSGQHILSAAFVRELGAETVSFHLGETYSTIDLTLDSLSADDVARVEDAANQVVFEDRPVTVGEYTAEETSRLSLRKPPPQRRRVRVVQIQGFDASACGGTHVRHTGEVGLVHVGGWQRRHGQLRVEFRCGWRALHSLHESTIVIRELTRRLSVGPEELNDAVERLAQAESEARHALKAVQAEILAYRTAELAGAAEPIGCWHLICRVLKGMDAGSVRRVAQGLVREPGVVVLLASTVDAPRSASGEARAVRGDSSPQLIFARSDDVALDMPSFLQEVVGPFGGRGGGQPWMATGGAIPTEALDEVLEQARARLKALSE